jgi:chromosome segregation protein
MKLLSLRLHGFKSFADKTTLEFRDGITAIVGSNGCGKSNVADAVRWVLGEQRASAVRGQKMDEVIFQGTSKRRALNFAEVTMLVSNEAGRVAVPQTEIELTRRVFREGGSEYALNRNTCRLRDIQGLLRDTGLGANAYAIIQQGMVETLLSDRADERRLLFEEAAGIGRYKDSRQQALRRLAGAESDLERLNDLVAEVESKVRSLARQRKRAQRHRELQARRLDLEVAIAQHELEAMRISLAEAEARWAALGREQAEVAAHCAAAEATAEARRVEALSLVQQRAAAAARLEEVRSRLDAREREVLLAEERRTHAEMRIAQLVKEKAELTERLGHLARERERAREEMERAANQLDALTERREERGEENDALRAMLAAERAAAEGAAARSRELAREMASLEGERGAAERRRSEAAERAARLKATEMELAAELERLSEQTDLWGGQAEAMRERVESLAEMAELAREEMRVLRGREQAALAALRAAEDRSQRLAAQVAAREALESSYEGFAPAVAAIMAERGRFDGVHGPLADFVAAEGASRAAATEAYLGPLLQALVVEDLATARTLRTWFREEWTGGGSLLLLPLDALAAQDVASAAAAPSAWAAALLGEVVVLGEAEDALAAGGGARVDAKGDVVDARGVVRLAERGAGEGILARREALARLRSERDAAAAEREACLSERDRLVDSLAELEERAREAEELRRTTEQELRRLEAESAAQRHRHTRTARDLEEARRTLAATAQAQNDVASRLSALAERLSELAGAVADADAAAEAARERLSEIELRWEDAREEEAELRVALTRLEGEHREAERRLRAAESGDGAVRGRLSALEKEAEEVRGSLEGLSGVRERAGGEIEELFRARDREASALALLDARLAEVEKESAAALEQARLQRRREAECSEERHRLELEAAELRSRMERARERLEVEWGRPWEALLAAATMPAEGDPAAWAAEVRETAVQLDQLGPVNMLAVEEHEEEEKRLNFLLEQRADLSKARDDLTAAIRQINRTARELFESTFDTVRENFVRVYQSLFPGGECGLWLTDPSDPLESAVEIHSSPKGKRTQRLHLLSGGERTLTALALLFALYLVKPSPFCVFDEVDAPLDESNVGRFIQLLHDFKGDSQFIVITHNPRTMEAADWIYGVTMEEPGVSSIVGVELRDAFVLGDRVA